MSATLFHNSLAKCQVAAGFYHTIVLTGGGKELLDLNSPEADVRLSPCDILNHPALSLPQDSCNEEIKAEKGHKYQAGLAGDVVSPEMSSPITTDQETAADAGGSVDGTPSNTMGSEVERQPEGGICHGDGRIIGRKAAVFIMAHMDRLAEKHSFAQECMPIVGHTDTGECDDKPDVARNGNGEEDESDTARDAKSDPDMYAVDVSPDTFELLAGILESTSGDEHFTCVSGEEESFRKYTLLAALRVLKVNLVGLIKSDVSTRIATSMLATPSSFDLEDTDDLRLDGKLGHDPVLYTPLLDPTPTRQGNSIHNCHKRKDRHAGTDEADGSSADVERYRIALYNLQRQLILLVKSYSSCGEGEGNGSGVETVQKEAAAVLVLGLELFFPGQTGQFSLLSKLISLGAADEDDNRDILFDGGSDNIDDTIRGPRAARHVLNPLLRRLCDDALVSKLIPYGAGAEKEESVRQTVTEFLPTLDGSKVTPPSARLLEIQVRSPPLGSDVNFCLHGLDRIQ